LSAAGVRAVVDTNVLISGLLWRGLPHAVMKHVRAGTLTLVSSPALIAEFTDVINRPKFHAILFKAGVVADQLLEELSQLTELIDPAPLPAPVCRDPDDDAVLALAVAAEADVIISGDADLLTLGSFAKIRIMDAATWLAEIEGNG
jgi:putative PIN family toxin of toxin-antitoxin system